MLTYPPKSIIQRSNWWVFPTKITFSFTFVHFHSPPGGSGYRTPQIRPKGFRSTTAGTYLQPIGVLILQYNLGSARCMIHLRYTNDT